jgi:hypothetical protein
MYTCETAREAVMKEEKLHTRKKFEKLKCY